jgi:hypothetical protein
LQKEWCFKDDVIDETLGCVEGESGLSFIDFVYAFLGRHVARDPAKSENHVTLLRVARQRLMGERSSIKSLRCRQWKNSSGGSPDSTPAIV